jgi:hypothetical protein
VYSQLKTLISLYQEEKSKLEKLIGECLAEEEYLMAHYYLNALYQVNSKLQTLNNIDDSHYNEKQVKIRRISSLEKQIKETDAGYLKEYYSRELFKLKEDLVKLNKIPGKTTQHETHLLLDKALTDLLDKKIKNLKLILKKTSNFFLAFIYSSKTLKVTLPNIKQHIKKGILHDENIETFKNIGFNMAENSSKLVLVIKGEKQEILYKLRIILMKIIFEIFYFKEFENESYIQFREKANR